MALDLDALDRGELPNKTYHTVDGDRAQVTDRLRRGHGSNVARVAVAPALFIEARPRADRYVFVLLRDLTKLDADAGTAARTWYDRNRESLTVDQGSDWINRLKAKIASYNGTPVAAPVEPKADLWAEWRTVAGELAGMGGQHGAGFAVDTTDGAVNRIAFWRIVPNHDGSRFFLRQVIGGQGAVRVRMSVDAMLSVARKIVAADPKAAMLRYGAELGECGHCYRELTNDESRAIGIGPVCRRKKGW